MKSGPMPNFPASGWSHPVRGAWIEMAYSGPLSAVYESHPVRGVWVEIPLLLAHIPGQCLSHPVRGVWVEIQKFPVSVDGFVGRTP